MNLVLKEMDPHSTRIQDLGNTQRSYIATALPPPFPWPAAGFQDEVTWSHYDSCVPQPSKATGDSADEVAPELEDTFTQTNNHDKGILK